MLTSRFDYTMLSAYSVASVHACINKARNNNLKLITFANCMFRTAAAAAVVLVYTHAVLVYTPAV